MLKLFSKLFTLFYSEFLQLRLYYAVHALIILKIITVFIGQ